MKVPTARQRLHAFCNDINFLAMPREAIAQYENFPFTIKADRLTDDFVLGTQEFATALVTWYVANGKRDDVIEVSVFASAMLYQWWKLNVRDNEFTEKEIEV